MDRRIDEYAGLRRTVEIGIRLAPTVAGAVPAAKSVASYLDADPSVPVRLAGISRDGSRVHLTLAINLGTVDDVKVAAPQSRAAVLMIASIVERLSAYDPSLVTLPHPSSPEARLASAVVRGTVSSSPMVESTVRHLVAVG
ncbi:MAG: hypothetical protein IPO93_13175 [Actinobacteria bacterium]|jgi:hypothetical protein|nr:hypothetical protein [Actinomycetota bacterium]